MHFKDYPGSINGMAQDNYGNIWIAARDNGLFKYDGTRMFHYKHERNNPNSLFTDRLECILADKDGTIWIGTWSEGLIHFNPVENTFTKYQYDEADFGGIRSNSITALAQDENRGIWIGTATGLDYFDPITQRFKHDFTQETDERYLQKEHIRSLYIDRSNVLWIGCGSPFYDDTSPGGLFKFDVENSKITRYINSPSPYSLIDNRVKAIFEDSQGTFWVGTAGDGLHTMNREKGNFIRHTYDPENPQKLSRPPQKNIFNYAIDHISFISEDAQGFIWIGTFGAGLNRYDPKNKRVQHFGSDETGVYHLENDSFWTSLITRDHLLWAGAWDSHNIYKINTLNKLTHNKYYNPIYSFAENNDGTIYMGAQNELLRENADQSLDTLLRLGNEEQFLVFLEISDEGNIWISSSLGLYNFNPRSGKLVAYTKDEKTNLKTDNIWNTKQLNSDSLLVGTPIGLYLLDLNSKKFKQYPYLDPVSDSPIEVRIARIFIDSHKNVWIGTREHSLKRFDMNSERFMDYRILEADNADIFDIYEDESQRLYVGSSRGLSQYNIGLDRFEAVDDLYGLMNEVPITAITAESDSILWLESDRGLIKFNIPTQAASLYNRSWGYEPDAGMHAGFFKSSRGDYYKGTFPGYYKFRFSKFDEVSEREIRPFIGEILVDNKPVVKSKDQNNQAEFQFLHNQNSISFELGYINYQSYPTDFMLQYSLGGFEDIWREGAHGEMVRYHSLAPGKYDFKIRAMDVYGDWQEATQIFQIVPPWWATWWAYAGYAIAIGWSVFAFYRFKLNQKLQKVEALRLKELDAVKTKLYTNITHEFRTPLTVILGMAEQILEHPKEHFKEGLNMIVRNGHNLLGLVNQMLDLRKLESGKLNLKYQQADIVGYIKYIAESFHSLGENKGIQIHFLADKDELIMDFDEVRLQQIASNLIANAVKFTPRGGHIYISTGEKDNCFILKIKDTGIGIKKADLPYVFDRFYQSDGSHTRHSEGTGIGLALTLELVKLMGGTMSVKSYKRKGAEFIVNLPIHHSSEFGEPVMESSFSKTNSNSEDLAFIEETTLPVISIDELDEENDLQEAPIVLIADDNDDVRNYIASCLVKEYGVKIAENGAECERIAKDVIPDLIVLDVMMPYKDGFEVCKLLKTDERTSHIPIIMLTAKADMDSRLEGLELGADAYLTKPFHKKELLTRISNLLSIRRQLQKYYRSSLEQGLAAVKEDTREIDVVSLNQVAPKSQLIIDSEYSYNPSIPHDLSLENTFVIKAKNEIEAHLAEEAFNVGKLCRLLALSNSQVHRKLSALTGLSATHFIRYVRLIKAKEMLVESRFKISAIALDCGFNDPSYFSRVFKKEFGISPQQWRNKNTEVQG